MNVNIGGVISVAFFYCLILVVGIWVGWKEKRKFKQLQRMESGANRSENIMLAGRDMGLFVGVLTMTGNDECCPDSVYKRGRFGFQQAGLNNNNYDSDVGSRRLHQRHL